MATNEPGECSLCTEEYNEEERKPRSLHCAHTLCTECLEDLIRRDNKVCPFCRQSFQARSAKELGVNTYALDFMKLLKEMNRKSIAQSQTTKASSSKQTKLKELKYETVECTQEIIKSIQQAVEQNTSTINSMKEVKEHVLQEITLIKAEILRKMEEIVAKSMQRVKQLEDQITELESQNKALSHKQRQMEKAMEEIEGASTLTHAGPLIDKVEDINTQAQKSLESLNSIISRDEKALRALRKVAKDMNDKMSIISEVLNSPLDGEDDLQSLPSVQHLTIQETVPHKITMESLQGKSESALRLISQGKVFAVQENEGERKLAKVTIDEENRICVHHICEQILPQDAQLLQHSDLMKLMNLDSRLTFLELSDDNKRILGRLYIRITPNGTRAQNFVLLCTAETGHTYANSKILAIFSKGYNGETIRFGDYENKGGKGGKALVPIPQKETGGVYTRPWLAGAIVGMGPWGGEAEASQFYIYTKDFPRKTLNYCFGIVERGLNVLIDAIAQHPNIKNVFISDTGIVLPV